MTRLFTVLGLGFALAFGIAGPGCKKAADPPSQVAIALEVEIAPVADDHPWVIAFLTETTIAQPPGIDARLEGRTEHDGRYFPEPIFEAETREVLAQWLTKHEAAHARPPELAPVWEPEPFGPDRDPAWRLHFIDRSAGFVLDSEASAFLQSNTVGPSVIVQFSPAQREIFATMTHDYLGRRAAFLIAGEVAMVPVIRSPITDGKVMLIGDPSEDPEVAAPALLNRLAGG